MIATRPRLGYACPRCRGELRAGESGLGCLGCAARYGLLESGGGDFCDGDAGGFADWWAADPDSRRAWLRDEAPREEAYQRHLAERYVLPLLRRLGYRPGEAAILSVACGCGADVDALNDAGFATWGVDNGGRARRWGARRHGAALARADLFALPFPEGAFDLVLGLNLLEHIGTVGDTTVATPDAERLRLAALRALLVVAKPGGYVLLSGVNRRFPLDPFHRQGARGPRLHWPWERFSLSYGDQRRLALATGLAAWARPLPLQGFFAYTTLRHTGAPGLFVTLLDWALGALPAAAYGSWLSFFTVVLVRRRGGGSDAAAGRGE